MNIKYESWKLNYYTQNGGYPVPTFTAKIGENSDGVWYVRVKYIMESAMQEISFDYSVDGESPFLKDEVVYAEDYVKAYNETYHTKRIKYNQFNREVEQFMALHGIG